MPRRRGSSRSCDAEGEFATGRAVSSGRHRSPSVGRMSNGHAWVLGATGQIGRAAVRALAADGWEVTAVSRGGGRD
ncbi:NAD-dependent epimerase/dehydratase family protein, partial [Streptomyces sp. FL06-04B]|uniref:NAD-dependent epimerase/dehydratase family protein n=1 Tax=Streptomyces sp. FL06-04B TaxID=3028657 RepID=UPI0029BE4B03